MSAGNIWLWIGFTVFVLALLALDLGVFHRKTHAVALKEALAWSVAWIVLSLAFNVGVYLLSGPEPALQFLTGYLIEKSLSVDNIFIFVLLFAYFRVPAEYQHRVLFWGVLGALVMRATLILVGAALLETFHWIIYLFGAFLIFTGIRMAFHREQEVHPDKNPVVRLIRRVVPVKSDYAGKRFFVREHGKLFVTPLLIVLAVIETTDLIFALDSIPAIFAVTTDPFIVYTSNVFAILGLRSLYFVFARLVDKFYYLQIALAIILTFVGLKMVAADFYHVPTIASLLFIALVLTIAVIASVVRARLIAGREREREREHEREGETLPL
ncbi:MAG: TerC family protein [Ktedonobacteraceae bacterium]|nr:TerC family protein [Ktedonobacteraceae bacterium]